MNYIILENVRSAYNVWNLFRTADALGRWVVLSGYTPDPNTQPKVAKTSLWAEKSVPLIKFPNSEFDNSKAISWAKENWYFVISAEITDNSIDLVTFSKNKSDYISSSEQPIAIVLGNEVSWVFEKTLEASDIVVHIPMQWIKASLNVWQAWAIFMRELWNDRKFGK